MSVDDATQEVTSATSEVWSNHVPVPGHAGGIHGSHHLSDESRTGSR